MAMSEGTITINPLTGVASGAGAAKEVFDAMDASQDYGAAAGATLAEAKERIAALARACAKIIPHIQTNAVVTTSVATTTVGVATGVVAGAATAPTAGTGSGSGTGTIA